MHHASGLEITSSPFAFMEVGYSHGVTIRKSSDVEETVFQVDIAELSGSQIDVYIRYTSVQTHGSDKHLCIAIIVCVHKHTCMHIHDIY